MSIWDIPHSFVYVVSTLSGPLLLTWVPYPVTKLTPPAQRNLRRLEFVQNAVFPFLRQRVLGAEVVVVPGDGVQGGVHVAVGGAAGNSFIATVLRHPGVRELTRLFNRPRFVGRIAWQIESVLDLFNHRGGLFRVLDDRIAAQAEQREGGGGFGCGNKRQRGERLQRDFASGRRGLDL